MNQFDTAVEMVARAVGPLGERGFSWLGQRVVALDPTTRRSLSAAAVDTLLRSELQRTLYENFFITGQPRTMVSDVHDRVFLPGELGDVADSNRYCQEGGWIAVGALSDRVLVRRDELTLAVPADRCSPLPVRDGHWPIPILLSLPRTRPKLSPGYHMIFGAAPQSERDVQVRLYWHLDFEVLAEWASAATRLLDACRLPYCLKILNTRRYRTRCDSAVLYVPRSIWDTVRPIVTRLYGKFAGALQPNIPVFTKLLAPGLSLAESPGSESFGMHRCNLLAAGLLRAAKLERASTTDRVRCITTCWKEAGLSTEVPYLNQGSMDGYPVTLTVRPKRPAAENGAPQEAISLTECFEWASDIGTALAREAIWSGARCTWLGEHGGKEHRGFGTLSGDLYSGASGLALFLSSLANVSGRPDLRRVALGAIRQTLALVDAAAPVNTYGLFTGHFGACWAAAAAATILEESDLALEAGVALKRGDALSRVSRNTEWDLLAGRGGAILAILSMRSVLSDDFALSRASELGRELLQSGRTDRHGGVRWPQPRSSTSCGLTGFAHGAAGAGIALLELGAATGERSFTEAGCAAFAYERRWFDPEQGNWRDLRRHPDEVSSTEGAYATTWCHGAPGIALTRCRALDLIQIPQYRDELASALATTTNALRSSLSEPQPDLCLCHGLLGNTEVLNYCAVDGASSLARRAAAHGRRVYVEGMRRQTCQNTAAGDPPGLMLGRAGIGFFFLRMADPSIPSPIAVPAPLQDWSRAERSQRQANCSLA